MRRCFTKKNPGPDIKKLVIKKDDINIGLQSNDINILLLTYVTLFKILLFTYVTLFNILIQSILTLSNILLI